MPIRHIINAAINDGSIRQWFQTYPDDDIYSFLHLGINPTEEEIVERCNGLNDILCTEFEQKKFNLAREIISDSIKRRYFLAIYMKKDEKERISIQKWQITEWFKKYPYQSPFTFLDITEKSTIKEIKRTCKILEQNSSELFFDKVDEAKDIAEYALSEELFTKSHYLFNYTKDLINERMNKEWKQDKEFNEKIDNFLNQQQSPRIFSMFGKRYSDDPDQQLFKKNVQWSQNTLRALSQRRNHNENTLNRINNLGYMQHASAIPFFNISKLIKFKR